MSRRNNKAASQAETADLISALSEAASSSSSSAPINATRGASTALLAKDSATHDSQPVATSTGLGFRSFSSPIASQSVPNAAISVFLTKEDVPPSNQLEAQQLVVYDTTSLGQPGGIQLPKVTLPLSALQMKTAYSQLRTL